MNNFLLSTAMLLGLTLSGCDNSPKQNTVPAEVQTQKANTNTKPTIVSKTTIYSEYISPLPDNAPFVRVAVTGVDEPFTFKDELGKLQGIEIDIIREIGVAEGFKVIFQKSPRSNLLSEVEKGKYPMTIAVLSDTEERRQKFILSDPYFSSPSVLIYMDENIKIKTGYKDLVGKKIGVIEDSYHSKALEKDGTQSELIYIDTPYLLLNRLLKGDIDAGVQDQTLMQYMIKQYPEVQGKVKFAPYLVNEPSNVVMAINKEEIQLAEQINNGIKTIKENGQLDKITEKWLGVKTSIPQ